EERGEPGLVGYMLTRFDPETQKLGLGSFSKKKFVRDTSAICHHTPSYNIDDYRRSSDYDLVFLAFCTDAQKLASLSHTPPVTITGVKTSAWAFAEMDYNAHLFCRTVPTLLSKSSPSQGEALFSYALSSSMMSLSRAQLRGAEKKRENSCANESTPRPSQLLYDERNRCSGPSSPVPSALGRVLNLLFMTNDDYGFSSIGALHNMDLSRNRQMQILYHPSISIPTIPINRHSNLYLVVLYHIEPLCTIHSPKRCISTVPPRSSSSALGGELDWTASRAMPNKHDERRTLHTKRTHQVHSHRKNGSPHANSITPTQRV
ncbi:3981_t:CDS:2, partial [Acaulospora colombiana]